MTAHPVILHALSGIEVLHLRPAQDAIRDKHGPRYHLCEDCLWDIAALWGIERQHETINDAGVFANCLNAVDVSSGRSRAEICVARSPSGLWAMDTCFRMPTYGASAAPGVWNPVAYHSENDARLTGLAVLMARFHTFASMNGPDASDARRMIALLEAEKTPQLTLF